MDFKLGSDLKIDLIGRIEDIIETCTYTHFDKTIIKGLILHHNT